MNLARFHVFVLLATALSIGCGGPSGPPVAAISLDSARLLADLSALAHDSMGGRAPGTSGSAQASALIEAALREAGVGPAEEGYRQPFTWSGGAGVNLVAEIAGRDPDARYIVLSAHYDHEGVRDGEIYNGADDNASGVAAVLAAARIFARQPLEHPLLLAFVDAEEEGMRGSRALVADPPVPLEQVALNVNLDMVSRTDDTLWAGGAYHTPALRPVLEAVAADAPLTLLLGHDRPGAPEGDDWTNASDHAAFHEVGIPFVYFGVEDHPDYHRPTDDFERVDAGEFVASVRTIISAVRALDAALPLPVAAGPAASAETEEPSGPDATPASADVAASPVP